MGKGLAIFGEGGKFGESVAAAGEQLFGLARIESQGELESFRFIEFGAGKFHGRMQAIYGDARPWDVHGCGIWDCDDTNRARGPKRFPSLRKSAVVRGESRRDVRSGTVDENDDFSGQILAGEIVKLLFGNLQAIAGKNEWCRDLAFTRVAPS